MVFLFNHSVIDFSFAKRPKIIPNKIKLISKDDILWVPTFKSFLKVFILNIKCDFKCKNYEMSIVVEIPNTLRPWNSRKFHFKPTYNSPDLILWYFVLSYSSLPFLFEYFLFFSFIFCGYFHFPIYIYIYPNCGCRKGCLKHQKRIRWS